MNCDKCESDRILIFDAKCDDRCCVQFNNAERVDYPPSDIGLSGGDYISGKLCLQCGKVQGEFPIPDPEFSQEDEDDF